MAIAGLMTSESADATTLYWDLNGQTVNSGTGAAGTWQTTSTAASMRWNSDSTGGAGGTITGTVTSGDDLVFSSGTNYNSGTAAAIAVTGAQSANSITLQEGTLTFNGVTTPSLSIGAGGITLADGLNGTATFSTTLPIFLAASQTWTNSTTTTARAFTVNSSISGTAASGVQSLTIAGASTANNTLAGVISDGTGGGGKLSLTAALTGTLRLDGANSYSGGTTISSGTVQVRVASVGSVGAITTSAFGTGALQINGGVISSGDTTARTILNDWALGGNATLGNGTNNGALTISGAGTITGATRQLTINSAVTIDGNIGDGGNTYGLTKAGNSLLVLSGTNTFKGTLSATAGALRLGSAGAWNTAFSNLILNGGVLELGNDNLTTTLGTGAGQIQVLGATAGFGAYGAARTVNLGSVAWGSANFNPTTSLQLGSTTSDNKVIFAGAIDLSGASRTINVVHGGQAAGVADAEITADLSATFGASQSLTFAGGGTVILSGSNTYNNASGASSGTLITGGTTVVGSSFGNWDATTPTASSFGAPTTAVAGRIVIGSGVAGVGALRYVGPGESTNRTISFGGGGSGNSPTTATLESSGDGALTISSVATSSAGTGAGVFITLGGTNSGDNTISAAINNVPGTRQNTRITKTGTGTWVLSGNSNFSNGPLNVNGGTLVGKGDVEGSVFATGTLNATTVINDIDTTGLTVGDLVYGTNVTGDLTVTIASIGTNSITVSAATGLTGSGLQLEFVNTAAQTSVFGSSRSRLTLGSAATNTFGWNAGILVDGAFTIARPILVNNIATAGTYSIGGRSTSATASFSGLVTANQSLSVTQAAGGTLNVTGGITGSTVLDNGTQTITFAGPGTINLGTTAISEGTGGGSTQTAVAVTGGVVTFNIGNTYDGPTNVSGGTFVVTNASGSATGNGAVTLSGTAALQGTGFIAGVTNLNGTNALSSTGTLTLSGGLSVAGTATISSGTIAGNATVANAGALAVNGTLNGAATVGGTLSGNGTVSGNVTLNGTLAPGASEGKLTIGGTLDLNGLAALEVEGTTRGVDTGYDAIDATTVDYTSGTLSLSFQNVAAFADGTTFDLFAFSGQTGDLAAVNVAGFYGGAGTALVNNGGVWSGDFGDQTLSFTQNNGDLSIVTSVPEPTSLALIALGGMAMLRRRRRQVM